MVRTRSNKTLNEAKVQKKRFQKERTAKLSSKVQISIVKIRLIRDPIMSSTSLCKSTGEREHRSGVKRANEKSSNEQTIKKRVNVQSKPSTPTLQTAIDAAYREAKKKFGETKKPLKTDDFVLARMRGYAPWPSKIVVLQKISKEPNVIFSAATTPERLIVMK